ncbi:MAG TPA: response regulator transcription factor [Bacteroidales bacterium]|nr:response regulator transcription factor [Bacteroidales bacterium]HRZ76291.1 response regulator transcription factor [Bacteroidales bacterium]
MKTDARILMVEDDLNLSTVLQDYLEMLGYHVTVCRDGEEGKHAFENGSYDLCLLDVMMPRKDGFTLAQEIRESDELMPIIFLTAKSLKEDRIKGFRTGCDDYITKPFSTEELSLRISAVLRRCQTSLAFNAEEKVKFIIGRYTFDYSNMTLGMGDSSHTLTRKQADLLRLLCENENQLVKRETALKLVWGSDDYFIGRSMDVFITKLRKYLREDPNISITNVHGTGFKLETR